MRETIEHLRPASPVEVDVSRRCEHECFAITMGSQSVWYLPGIGKVLAAPNDFWMFHRHQTVEGESCCDCMP